MSGVAKLAIYVIFGLIAVTVTLKVLQFVWAAILNLIIPLAIVGGIGLFIYSFVNKKVLGGGGRSLP